MVGYGNVLICFNLFQIALLLKIRFIDEDLANNSLPDKVRGCVADNN